MTAQEQVETILRDHGRDATAARVAARAATPVLAALVKLSDLGGGVAPTGREIGDECGLRSTSTVRHHLRTLAEIDLVKLPALGEPRSIRVSERGRSIIEEAS